MATQLNPPDPADIAWANAFRALVTEHLPTLPDLATLTDKTCADLLRDPSLITRWLEGARTMPHDVRALGYSDDTWQAVQATCDDILTSLFETAWDWVTPRLRKVYAYLTRYQRRLLEYGLATAWSTPELVHRVIVEAAENPYPLIAAAAEADIDARELFEVCDRIARAKAPALSRDRGAILAVMAAETQQGHYVYDLVDDQGGPDKVLKAAAMLLDTKPAAQERTAARLARTWKQILPVHESLRFTRVDQEYSDWPVKLHVIPHQDGTRVRVMPQWVQWTRAGSANQILERLNTTPFPLKRAAARVIQHADISGQPLDPEQQAAIQNAFRRSLSIITGGPGTGKTSVCRVIAEAAQAAGLTVLGFAPTGRAAQRLESLTGIPSRTIHSGLMTHGHTRHGHMERCDLAIIDESSMLDTKTLHAALVATDGSADRICFIGDPDQLPPVDRTDVWCGFVNVLGDHAPAAITQLVTRHRSDAIVHNARWLFGEHDQWIWDNTVRHVAVPPLDRGAGLTPEWEAAIRTWAAPRDHENTWQALAYTRDLVRETNAVLRAVVHGATPRSFQPRDRVVQMKNEYRRHDLRNGEQAVIVATDGRQHTAEFTDHTVVASETYARRYWEFGWAVTIHRAQGGEWDDLLLVLPARHQKGYTRQLLYTALTRVRHGTVTILSDDPGAVLQAARRHHGIQRTPFSFEHYLRAALRKRLLA
jgi:hypothetical protein